MGTDLNHLILEILSKKKVRNQGALAKLIRNHGLLPNQSTLSRRLKKLGIQKKDGHYFVPQTKDGLPKVLQVPPNLIVVRTLPGHAQAMAYLLDNQALPGLVGTIAGDDTVLCIVQNPDQLPTIAARISVASS